jgi:hypothetical protein
VLRCSDYAGAKEAFDGKYARQQAVLAKLRPDKLVDSLTEKTNEAEAKSEEIQETFMQVWGLAAAGVFNVSYVSRIGLLCFLSNCTCGQWPHMWTVRNQIHELALSPVRWSLLYLMP